MMGYLLGSEDGEKDKPTVKAVGTVAFAGWGILMGIQKIEENGLRLLTIFLYCHSNAKE